MLIITSSIFVHLAIISDYFSNKSLFGAFLKEKELPLYYVLFINSVNFARTLGLAKYSYYIITVDSDSFHTIMPLIFTSTLFLCLPFPPCLCSQEQQTNCWKSARERALSSDSNTTLKSKRCIVVPAEFYPLKLARECFCLWSRWFCELISLIKLEWVGDKKTFYYYDNSYRGA